MSDVEAAFDQVLQQRPDLRYSIVARLTDGYMVYDHQEHKVLKCVETVDPTTEGAFLCEGFVFIRRVEA